MNTTAAGASEVATGGSGAGARRIVGRSATTPSARCRAEDMAVAENRRPGHRSALRGRQRLRDADEVSRVGRLDRRAHALRAEPGVDQHDHRTGAPARVERHREVDTGRHHQRDTITGGDAGADETASGLLDQRVELGERDPGAVAGGVGHGELAPEVAVHVAERRDVRVAGAGGRSRRRAERAEPVDDRADGVDVLRHEVGCLRVAVHRRVRQPALEVVQVEVGEHLVGRAPQQQHRHVAPARRARRRCR